MTENNILTHVLQQYHNHGLASRIAMVNLFIDEAKKLMKVKEPDEMFHDNFGLTQDQKLASLQLGIISNLMILTEDIGLFCFSVLKNEQNYYRYLDSKGDDELGQFIRSFYSKIESLTNDEIRIIMSYVHPEFYDFNSENEKMTYIKILNKSINFARLFLGKTMVFRDSHIDIFRRYKHAMFPILLSNEEISKQNDRAHYYDFVSYAFTSSKSISDKLISIPFSLKVLESYQIFLADIYLFARTVINSRLLCLQRNVDGVYPYKGDFIAKKFSPEDRKTLEKIWIDFENKNQVVGRGYKVHFDLWLEDTPWYVNSDFYLRSAMDLAEEHEKKQ